MRIDAKTAPLPFHGRVYIDNVDVTSICRAADDEAGTVTVFVTVPTRDKSSLIGLLDSSSGEVKAAEVTLAGVVRIEMDAA